MKCVIFLCLLALAVAEKRMFVSNLIDNQEFHNLLDAVSEKFGTDATEQQCEQECHAIFKIDLLELFACPAACNGIESALKKIHSHTEPPVVQAMVP